MLADLKLDPAASDQTLLSLVLDFYHRTLKDNPAALDALRQRGFTNAAGIDAFQIGYANRTLGQMIPAKAQGRPIRKRLVDVGIFRSWSGHERFLRCLTFPIYAVDGSKQIVDVYGRRLRGKSCWGHGEAHQHLNFDKRGVWNLKAFAASQEMILCCSLFDALTFWTHNHRNVTCMFGEDALTIDHLDALRRHGIKRVLTPCRKTVSKLVDAGFDSGLLAIPQGKDVNAFALQWSDAGEALDRIVQKAKWTKPTTSVALPASPPITPASPEAALLAPLSAQQPQAVEEDLPASSVEPEEPGAPLSDAPSTLTDANADEVSITCGTRHYRIRGIARNLASNTCKVNVFVANADALFIDTFDLYSAKHRRQFISQAAAELDVVEQTIKKDLDRVLRHLEQLQAERIAKAAAEKVSVPKMTDADRKEALALLDDPKLLDRILTDFSLVGEDTNKLVGYLAAISRKLNDPLAVVIQSTSAAGKTALMDAVLAFVPPEDLVKLSAMTGQSLFYMGSVGLKHKILAIVEEEGAERASYALKLLQSEGELRIASTGKDSGTGRLTSQEYCVEGPTMLFLTTTSSTVDEELLNRCLVLTVNEDREQTKAIHEAQRKKQTLAGMLASQERQQVLTLHRNAQRLLRPLLVVNPHAEKLTFLDDRIRTRRDHAKYLTLIRAVALLHQHQRPVKAVVHQGRQVEYIEATHEDIAIANKLAGAVMGCCHDEMPPQTRRLLSLLDRMVTAICTAKGIHRADCRFTRREVRECTGWGQTQLQLHLRRLVELEYLAVHGGGRGRSCLYELLYQAPANNDGGLLNHLADVRTRLPETGANHGQLSGVNGQLSG